MGNKHSIQRSESMPGPQTPKEKKLTIFKLFSHKSKSKTLPSPKKFQSMSPSVKSGDRLITQEELQKHATEEDQGTC